MTARDLSDQEAQQSRPATSIKVSPWMFADAVLWAIILIAAVWLRFDFSVARLGSTIGTAGFYLLLLTLIVLTWLLGMYTGIYRGRFVPGSLLEVSTLTTVFAIAVVGVFIVHLFVGQHDEIPRSIPLVAGAFAILTSLVIRSLVRRKQLFGAGVPDSAEPTIVFGAGDGGLLLVRQLRRSRVSQFRPVAILDDDPEKKNMMIESVKVVGNRDAIESVAKRTGASTMVIAIPSLPGDEVVKLRDRAESAGLHALILPTLDALMQGRVAADELREINVNDLLGRKPTMLNQVQIAEYLAGKRVMVTGAGGSIGSELCRQLSRFNPAELMMLDRDESGLHSVQLSIQEKAMLDGEDTILASIRDRASIHEIFARRKPEIVFHAAALKHMPLLEQYPLEALKTNVLGTLNVLDAAESCGVTTFINVSTDKAANPCSALGTSKRIAERLTANKASECSRTKSVSVRFGNVLGSRGSVLTVFEKQIKDGGPVTVTDPEVNRYFMTIPEACQLVLQAAVVGENGDTLVLDMGEPVRIQDVARTLIDQSGKDIEIVYTGLRENEKMAEELFDDTEVPVVGTKHEALSEVRVPGLLVDRDEVEQIGEHSAAKKWLDSHVYPERILAGNR